MLNLEELSADYMAILDDLQTEYEQQRNAERSPSRIAALDKAFQETRARMIQDCREARRAAQGGADQH